MPRDEVTLRINGIQCAAGSSVSAGESELMRHIQRQTKHLTDKIRNVVARGVVSLVNDGLKMQGCQLKLLAGELVDNAEHPQNYGFTSHPHPGAEAFVVFANADRGQPLILVVDDRRFRVKGLTQGEVCLYTDEGDTITLKRGNRVEVKTHYAVVDAEQDITALAGGDVFVQAGQDITVTAGANLTAQVTGKAAVNAANVEIAATNAIMLTAPVITLAGGVMLPPAPGASGAGMSSAAPISITAPEITISEEC